MKIREGWFGAGWYTACALLCVCAHPTRYQTDEMYISGSKSSDPKSMASSYRFKEEISASKLSEIVEDSLEELEDEGLSTMRAITTRAKSKAVLLPLILEPEAEMLPPGYKGVKPPGVSHMELVKPRTGPSAYKSAALRASITDNGNSDKSGGFDRNDDAHYAASEHETQIARDGQAGDKLVVLEVGLISDSKENKKSEKAESSGAGRSYLKNEDHAKDHKDGIVEKKGAAYKGGDTHHKKIHNAAGYRNVYHKDEFKKNADFYDNGRQGGHFEKHGRYDEKHAAAENIYERGRNSDSSPAEVETNKQRKFEKTRVS